MKWTSGDNPYNPGPGARHRDHYWMTLPGGMTGYCKTGLNKLFPFSRATCRPKSEARMTFYFNTAGVGAENCDVVDGRIYILR